MRQRPSIFHGSRRRAEAGSHTSVCPSGDKHTGWIMHVRSQAGTVASYGFESPDVNIFPKDYQRREGENIAGIAFEACEIAQIAVNVKDVTRSQESEEVEAVYSFDGKKVTGHKASPRIIHYKDGHSEKVW